MFTNGLAVETALRSEKVSMPPLPQLDEGVQAFGQDSLVMSKSEEPLSPS